MADFRNPIQLQNAAVSPAAPVGTSSSAQSILDIASVGLQAYGISQRQKQEAAALEQASAQRESLFSTENLALSRISTFNELMGERGAVKANAYLEQVYHADMQTLSSSEDIKGYREIFQHVYGGAPTEILRKEMERQEQTRASSDAGYIDEASNYYVSLGIDPGTIPEASLVKQGRYLAGEAAEISRNSSRASLEATTMSNTSTREKRINSAVVQNFSTAIRADVTSLTDNLIAARRSQDKGRIDQSTTALYTWLEDHRTSFRSNLVQAASLGVSNPETGETHPGNGAVLTDSDFGIIQKQFDDIESLLQNEMASGMTEAQNKHVIQVLTSELYRDAPDFAMDLVVAASTGAPVNLSRIASASQAREEFGLSSSDTAAIISASFQGPPTRTARDSEDPQASFNTLTKSYGRSFSIFDTLDPKNRGQAGVSVGNTLMSNVVGGRKDSTLANNRGGLPEVYKALALNPQAASDPDFLEGMQDAAEEYGMTVPELFRRSYTNFLDSTLLPSLSTKMGSAFNKPGTPLIDMLDASLEGGSIKLRVKPELIDNSDVQDGLRSGRASAQHMYNMRLSEQAKMQGYVDEVQRQLSQIIHAEKLVTGHVWGEEDLENFRLLLQSL